MELGYFHRRKVVVIFICRKNAAKSIKILGILLHSSINEATKSNQKAFEIEVICVAFLLLS